MFILANSPTHAPTLQSKRNGASPIPSNRHSDGFKEVRLRMWWISMVIVLGFCCFASLFNDSRVDPGLAGRDHLKGYFFDQHFEPSRYCVSGMERSHRRVYK